MSEATSSFSDEELSELCIYIWEQTIEVVNNLLDAHNRVGFTHFKQLLDPTLEEILAAFELAEFALSTLLKHVDLKWDEFRRVINSQQCILHVRAVAAAYESGNQENYEEAIKLLHNQAKI